MKFLTEEELYHIIGLNIKRYREAAKLTQQQLAEKANISVSYLSKIESVKCHKSLSIAVLNQLSQVLNVEITNFFQEENHEIM